MFYSSNTALIIFVLILDGIASGFVAPSPQTLFRRLPIPLTAISQARNGPSSSPYVDPSGARSSTHNSTITTAPSAYPQDSNPSANWCLAGRPACSGTKTWDGPSLSLSEQCVLWDSSCTGDIDSAARNFFDNRWMADEKPCWKFSNNASLSCTLYETPETLSAMSRMKDWMRGTQCLALSRSLHPLTTTITNGGSTLVTTTAEATAVGETCCGNAIIEAQNVDIYYWPEPGTNTSCLSVVGTSVNPLYYGATTGSGPAYWGCTAKDSTTSTLISMLGSPGTEEVWTTVMDPQSIITTARITEVNSLTFKIPLVNPWSPPACVGVTPAFPNPSTSTPNSVAQKSIHARGHSLVIASSITQDDGLPVSTVVSGSFTFTSPSIYANFHSISAADWCGPVGSQATITQTMLTFSAGELSTIAGPLHNPVGSSHQNFSTRMFDFADLPCPPQSVMEENWYIPAPGEPYRPLLALPKKVVDIDPAYTSVSDAFFTAYDPPKTLAVAAAMVPAITTVHAIVPPIVPTPGPGLGVGASKTADLNEASSISSISVKSQIVPLPGKTTDPGSDPGQDLRSRLPQLESKQQGNGPETLINPGKQSGTIQDPVMASRSSTLENAKPTNQVKSGQDLEGTSPDQISRMESALAPRPQSLLIVGPSKQPNISPTGLPSGSQQLPKGSPPFENTAAQPAQSFSSSGTSSFPEVYLTAADDSMGIVASDVPEKTENAATVPRVMPTRQSKSFEGGDVIVHLSGLESTLATSHGGHALQAVSNGASIQGDTIIAGPTISETAISIGSAYSIPLEGTPNLLSTPSPAPTTIPVNGAVAVPLQNGVSSTTLTVGAPAIAGTPVSLDASSKLAVGDGGTNIDTSLAFTSPDPSKSDASIHMTSIHQATAAASTPIEVDPTHVRSASVVTTFGMSPTLDSNGESVVDSVTLVLHSSNGSLGSLMVDVLHTGGTPANSALTSSQIPGPNSKPSGGHNFKSIAESAQSGFTRIIIIAFVAMLTVWLHT